MRGLSRRIFAEILNAAEIALRKMGVR